VQTVYFVRRQAAASGDAEGALPVVLVDAALEHRYDDVVLLEVVDDPGRGGRADATAVFSIDVREASLYGDARFAAIVRDRRVAEKVVSMRRPEGSASASTGA
jgi:hypothetical protein